jgi:hypothetical protein
MSTPKQEFASESNRTLASAPVTSLRKRTSPVNAFQHGMVCRPNALTGEARERFENILDGLNADLKPQTEPEQALVETMALARWRQLRIWSCETAHYQSAGTFHSVASDYRELDRFHRYESLADSLFWNSERQFWAARTRKITTPKGENKICEANLDIDLSQ